MREVNGRVGEFGNCQFCEVERRMKLLIAGIGAFFFVFATIRAARVPLTYDEAASYIRYIDTSAPSVFDTTALSIFNFEVATNHFVNTLLTKVSVVVAGNSELVLRIPNLIGYAMFLVFSALILWRCVRPWIAAAGLLLLNLNPYVLDFFGLSRGYGLSLGFLMGAMFFLFRLLDRVQARQDASHDASGTFAFALAGVMSNFALLNVWLVVVVLMLFAFVLQHVALAKTPVQDRAVSAVSGSWRSRVVLAVMATAFAALVFSQDSRLSSSLYEPVSVRIAGLGDAQRDRTTVVRTDLLGRESRLPRQAEAPEWRWPDRVPYRSLRIEFPVADVDHLELIEIAIGNRVFSCDPRRDVRWNRSESGSVLSFEADSSISLPRSRARHFRPVMNWAGDARYAASVASAVACTVGILAAFAFTLKALGWTLRQVKVIRQDHWRTIESGALWVAALAGPPIYLLRRNSELYFGGTRGLVADTLYSTIESSFYGRTYHPAQTEIVLAMVLISIVVGTALLVYRLLHRTVSPVMLPAAAVLTILIVTCLSLLLQRRLFGTVYLTGRTALFFIPLYGLLMVLVCEATAAIGPKGHMLAALLAVLVLSCATYHFTVSANTKYAWEWRDDASTRMMMEDLQLVLDAEGQGRSRVVLGVDSSYIPVATYYARRNHAPGIDVVSLPSNRRFDFAYRSNDPSIPAIRRYPFTQTMLVRAAF